MRVRWGRNSAAPCRALPPVYLYRDIYAATSSSLPQALSPKRRAFSASEGAVRRTVISRSCREHTKKHFGPSSFLSSWQVSSYGGSRGMPAITPCVSPSSFATLFASYYPGVDVDLDGCRCQRDSLVHSPHGWQCSSGRVI